jgi:hypothetical protein
MATVEVGEREEEIFVASGQEACRTAEITVRIAVPKWDDISAEDVIQEYARWLDMDPEDAVRGTSVRWKDTGDEVPLQEELPDTDEEDEEDD